MNNLNIENIKKIDGTEQLKKIYLVLFHPDKVPPHIGIIVYEKYFSLKISGIEISSSNALYRTIEIKKTPVLFFELKTHIKHDSIYKLTEKIFHTFQNVNEEVSCIEPIKTWVKELLSIEIQNINTLHQLIPALEKNNSIEAKYSLNITSCENGIFQLARYGKEEVQLRIKQLSL